MGIAAGQLATASMIGQGASVASGVFGSYFSSLAAKDQARFDAQIAAINSRMMEQRAQGLLRQGEVAIGQRTMEHGALRGRQRAALAANGVALNEGSAAEVVASGDLIKEIDVKNLQLSAISQAWGARKQAVDFQNQGRAADARAESANPWGAAATTLLGGATQLAGSWYSLDRAGMLDEFKANRTGDPIGAWIAMRG